VLDWSAAETADLLDMTVAAANSALQRARATLRERLPARPSEWSGSAPSEEERLLLEGFIDAHERADAAAAAALVREDIRITMPPHPWCFDGLAAIRPLLEQGLTEPGEWRLVPTRANRQPTAASYLRAPGDTESVPDRPAGRVRCCPRSSGRVGRPGNTAPSCCVARGGMTEGMTDGGPDQMAVESRRVLSR
jgi:hypothetical protein